MIPSLSPLQRMLKHWWEADNSWNDSSFSSMNPASPELSPAIRGILGAGGKKREVRSSYVKMSLPWSWSQISEKYIYIYLYINKKRKILHPRYCARLGMWQSSFHEVNGRFTFWTARWRTNFQKLLAQIWRNGRGIPYLQCRYNMIKADILQSMSRCTVH